MRALAAFRHEMAMSSVVTESEMNQTKDG